MDHHVIIDLYMPATRLTKDNYRVPVYTAISLFVHKFCQLDDRHRVHLVNIPVGFAEENCTVVGIDYSPSVDRIDFLPEYENLPALAKTCALPVIIGHREHLVVSGLCSVLRCLVTCAQKQNGDKVGESCNKKSGRSGADELYTGIGSLLGQRGNCLRACSEVSAWTKYCEVTLPGLVDHFIGGRTLDRGTVPPPALTQLENYLGQPVATAGCRGNTKRLGPSNRRRRSTVIPSSSSKSEPAAVSELRMTYEPSIIQLQAGDICTQIETRLSFVDETAAENDRPTRIFVEGDFLQLTDLIVFVCVELIFQNFADWERWIPGLQRLVAWYRMVSSLSCVCDAFSDLVLSVANTGSVGKENYGVAEQPFAKLMPHTNASSVMPSNAGENGANQNWTDSKFKATQSAIDDALQKLLNAGVAPTTLPQPCGEDDIRLPWKSFPSYILPMSEEGGVPDSRADRKLEQLENMAAAVLEIAESRKRSGNDGGIIVDFCSGGGHLGILLAHLLPQYTVMLVENKEVSLRRALDRIALLELPNVTLVQCNLGYFRAKFDIGVCLHACGVATDLVLEKCVEARASFAVCPCCYGSIRNTHSMAYPRSRAFREAGISYRDFLALGHAADQTQATIAKAEQGRTCMAYVDVDRCLATVEHAYRTNLYIMNPITCSTKNHILVGHL